MRRIGEAGIDARKPRIFRNLSLQHIRDGHQLTPYFAKRGENFIQIHAELDTGSMNWIFKRKHGELLDLEIENGEPTSIGTAAGKFPEFEHRITLITIGLSWETTVGFIAEEGIERNILGRFRWLDRLNIGLVDYEGKLLLSPMFEDYQN